MKLKKPIVPVREKYLSGRAIDTATDMKMIRIASKNKR